MRARPLALLAIVLVSLTGCGTAITADRVQDTFGRAFVPLYQRQQALMGQPARSAAWVSGSTRCQRTSPAMPDRGAGSDWQCHQTWRTPAGVEQEATYEVQVRASGCLTAGAPGAEAGPAALNVSGGQRRVNPIYEFDACFDPS